MLRNVLDHETGGLLVSLPKAASGEKVDAELKEGMLTIRIQKAEEAKPRTIEIK